MHSTRTKTQSPENPLGLATRSSAAADGGQNKTMDSTQEQLIELITQQVLEALGLPNSPANQSKNVPLAPVHIAPPVGTCTGDYSKFKDAAGNPIPSLTSAAIVPGKVIAGVSEAAGGFAPATLILRGIVTANELQKAMDAASDGVAVLAHDAKLSPLANDLARQKPTKIRRISAAEAAQHSDAPTASKLNLPWFWWIDGACPVVQDVTLARAGKLRSTTHTRSPAALTSVVRDLANAIRSNDVAGGLLFVNNAARAMCYLNRCASIRAVVGTCDQAVEQGIAEIGANVLVIEYPHHGNRSTAAMVDRMMQQLPAVPASVQRELSDLHRCG